MDHVLYITPLSQVMYAYYHDCDPMTTRQVHKKDQLFPLFVMQVISSQNNFTFNIKEADKVF